MSKDRNLRQLEMSVAWKLKRLRSGAKPRVLDLFAGCGGFSLGFQRAGCEILAGIELDPHAAATHAINIHRHQRGGPEFVFHARSRNLEELRPAEFLRSLGHAQPGRAVDLLIGGPPCPSFARVGRAKLRQIHQDPEAFKNDPRSKLYLPYLDFVRTLRPIALVMENVPEIMNFGGENLAETISALLEQTGYRIAYTLLNAANYGVPEMRERFFMVGVHDSTALDPSQLFPAPTHRVDFPPGYKGSRDVALKVVREAPSLSHALEESTPSQDTLDEVPTTHFVATPSQSALHPERHRPTSVREALRDLPQIKSHLHGTLGRGRRDLSEATADRYPTGASDAASPYVVQHIWNWPGLEAKVTGGLVTGHSIGLRKLSHRDYRIFRAMEEGDQYPQAYQLGLGFFRRYVERIQQAGSSLPDETKSGAALCEGIADLLTRLDGITAAPSSSDCEAARLRWLGLRESLDSHIDQLNAYSTVLAALRCEDGNLHPESSTVGDGQLMTRWEEIGGMLAQFSDPDAHTVYAEASTRRFIRYRRLKDAYARGQDDRAPEPHYIKPIDPAAGRSTRALAEAAKQYHEDWSAADRCTPRLLADHLRWVLLDFAVEISGYIALKHEFVPPYDASKFPNKWRKMEADEPARTLMAHLGKDSYSHIHYDSDQARTISVREAARLQSFPDTFVFEGSMNRAFRQIGNAVPPLLSFALGRQLVAALRQGTGRDATIEPPARQLV